MQVRPTHCGPCGCRVSKFSIYEQLEWVRASGGTQEGRLSRPCGNDADIGMRYQQREQRLQEKW